jgi:hypothetical protein
MSQPLLLAGIAFVGSLLLLVRQRPIPFPIVAFVVSAFEVLMAFNVVHFSAGKVPLPLVFGIALVVAGVGVLVTAASKANTIAATAVAIVGALQTLAAALHFKF